MSLRPVTPPPPLHCALLTPCVGRDWANQFCSAALCQVYDSIYMDVPMHRVKFNVNGEYAYVQNFKILQSRSTCRRVAVEVAETGC